MSKNAGRDSCDGDSGGPLVALEAGDGGGGVGGDVMYLVGVISFGTQSCGIGVPGSEVENEMEAKYRSSFFFLPSQPHSPTSGTTSTGSSVTSKIEKPTL